VSEFECSFSLFFQFCDAAKVAIICKRIFPKKNKINKEFATKYSFMFFRGRNFVTFDKEKKPWNLMLLPHLQLVWHSHLAQVLSHPQLIFPSKTWFFEIHLNFQRQKII